jgi:hypothetical protein
LGIKKTYGKEKQKCTNATNTWKELTAPENTAAFAAEGYFISE